MLKLVHWNDSRLLMTYKEYFWCTIFFDVSREAIHFDTITISRCPSPLYFSLSLKTDIESTLKDLPHSAMG